MRLLIMQTNFLGGITNPFAECIIFDYADDCFDETLQ